MMPVPNRVVFIVLARQGAWPSLLSVAAGGCQGEHSYDHRASSRLLGVGAEHHSPACYHKTDEKWRCLSQAHNFEAGSPTPLLTGLALLYSPDKLQGLLSQVLKVVGSRDSSPTIVTLCLTLPPALSIDGGQGGISSQPMSLCGR